MTPSKPSAGSARLDAFFAGLERLRLDGALVSRREDAHYLSGYTGSDAVLLFSVRRRRRWLITDARYCEEAEKTAPGFSVVLWRGGMATHCGALAKRNGLARIGYMPAAMSVSFFNSFRNEAGRGGKWVDVDPLLRKLRAVKSPAEVGAIETALACSEAAFRAARARWRAGMTEKEVKDDLEWEMRRRGADDAAFETIVASGANASLPHAHAGKGLLRKGKMLLIDFGAKVGFYNSDLTRTLWLDEVPKVWLKRYRAVLDARQAAVSLIAPGVPGADADNAARKILRGAGIEDRFTHSLGHGVGLAVHEEPRLSQGNREGLEPGNIVTVEPGVYYPGSGGIRVEDMVLVTPDGARVLSGLPRDVDSIVI